MQILSGSGIDRVRAIVWWRPSPHKRFYLSTFGCFSCYLHQQNKKGSTTDLDFRRFSAKVKQTNDYRPIFNIRLTHLQPINYLIFQTRCQKFWTLKKVLITLPELFNRRSIYATTQSAKMISAFESDWSLTTSPWLALDINRAYAAVYMSRISFMSLCRVLQFHAYLCPN